MLRLPQPPLPRCWSHPAGPAAPQDAAPAVSPVWRLPAALPGPGRPQGPAAGTFTAPHGDLRERVVAAVALPPYDARFARTLPRLHVASTRVGAGWEAVAGVAGVTALGPVVVGLEKPK